MQNINLSTSSANQNGGSLLSTTISSKTTQNVSNVILPYATLLPEGSYTSKILSVGEGIYNDKAFMDCIHELIDSGGNVRQVKFRFFAPVDTDALFKKLADYKLVGTVADVLVGLEENITIAPRPGSTKYVFISDRALTIPTVPTSPQKNPLFMESEITLVTQSTLHLKH